MFSAWTPSIRCPKIQPPLPKALAVAALLAVGGTPGGADEESRRSLAIRANPGEPPPTIAPCRRPRGRAPCRVSSGRSPFRIVQVGSTDRRRVDSHDCVCRVDQLWDPRPCPSRAGRDDMINKRLHREASWLRSALCSACACAPPRVRVDPEPAARPSVGRHQQNQYNQHGGAGEILEQLCDGVERLVMSSTR